MHAGQEGSGSPGFPSSHQVTGHRSVSFMTHAETFITYRLSTVRDTLGADGLSGEGDDRWYQLHNQRSGVSRAKRQPPFPTLRREPTEQFCYYINSTSTCDQLSKNDMCLRFMAHSSAFPKDYWNAGKEQMILCNRSGQTFPIKGQRNILGSADHEAKLRVRDRYLYKEEKKIIFKDETQIRNWVSLFCCFFCNIGLIMRSTEFFFVWDNPLLKWDSILPITKLICKYSLETEGHD